MSFKKNLNKFDILSAAKVGMEFEFFSEKSSGQITKDLGKFLNKKIVIPKETNAFDKEEKGTYHSEFEPTASIFKLEKDFSGGKDMHELITGPLPFEEGRLVIIKTLEWIKTNGWTDKKCAIHLNVSFNPFLINLKNDVSHLDPLKLILIYDEKFVYDRFPERKDSVYARSVNQVVPLNKYAFHTPYENVDSNNYSVPNEKYYGINFTKRAKNYLEFRYLGGKDYEYKTQKILEILDYSTLKLYEALQHPEFTSLDIEKLRGLLVDQKAISESFSSPERFFVKYPEIFVFIDMKGNKEIIKSYWTTVRDNLFSLIANGNLTKGIYNYDTDMSVSQLRYGKLDKVDLVQNFEMFDCDVNGHFCEVTFFRCKIRDSRLLKCKLMESNEIADSKIEHTTSYPGNALKNCYINCPESVIEGKIEGGVIRNAILGIAAEISKHTLTVQTSTPDDVKNTVGKHDKK